MKIFARYYYQPLFFSGKWPFGIDKKWLCQLAQSCKDVPVFLSSMTIVAIGKKSLKNYLDETDHYTSRVNIGPWLAKIITHIVTKH